MNTIISFFIKSILILSLFMVSSTVKAHDQIDYAANLVEADGYAFFASNQDFISNMDQPLIENPLNQKSKTSTITPPKTKQMQGRQSITFILGKDENYDLPFYEEAFYYFANHPFDQTEYIITSCRSLLDVRNYLAAYPTGNALPWSTINVVVPPNEVVENLKVPVFPQGIKSNLEGLEMVARQNDFPSLSSSQFDEYTTLYIHGTEVKKDSKLSYALQGLLIAKDRIAINPVFLDDSFVMETP